ncbi:hypothetical protein KM043_011178 [Ampulex compressa]|nr:hypothetical protein KM043_011178 [Ampulex compressa]
MLLSLFKDVVLELVVLLIGLLFWYEESFSASLLFEFVVVKVIPLILASYNWHSNMNLFKQLKRIDNLRRLRRAMLKRDSHNVRGSRMFDRIGESFDDSYSIVAIARRCASFPSIDGSHENYNYTSRSLTTLLTLSSQDSSETQDSNSGITDDSALTPAQKSMKILGITEEDVLKARERVQERSSRSAFKMTVILEKDEETLEEKQECIENAESNEECRLLMNVLKPQMSEKRDAMDVTIEDQIKGKDEGAKMIRQDRILKKKPDTSANDAKSSIEKRERPAKVEKKKSLLDDQKFSTKPCASLIRKRGIKPCSMGVGKNNKNVEKYSCCLKERLNLKFQAEKAALNSRKYWKLTSENCEDLSLVACSCRLKKFLDERNDKNRSVIWSGARKCPTKIPTYSMFSNKDALTLDSSRFQKNLTSIPKRVANKSSVTEYSFPQADLLSTLPACLKNNSLIADYSNKLDEIDFDKRAKAEIGILNKISNSEETKNTNCKIPLLHETSKTIAEELQAKLNSYVFAERMPWLNFPGIFFEDTGIPTFFKKSMKIFIRDYDKEPVKKPDLDYLHREINNKNWTVLTGKINRDIPGFLDKKDRISVPDKEELDRAEKQNLRTVSVETSSRDLTQDRRHVLQEDLSKRCAEKRFLTQGTQTEIEERDESDYKLRSGTRRKKNEDPSETHPRKTELFTRETQTKVPNRAPRIDVSQRLRATNFDYVTESRVHSSMRNARRNGSKHSLRTATMSKSNKPLDRPCPPKSKDRSSKEKREHLDPRANCPRKDSWSEKLQKDSMPLKISSVKFEPGWQKERKKSTKSGLKDWGTVTLAEVALSSGYDKQNLRGKPPVYPQKSQRTDSTRKSIVEKENSRKTENKYSERRMDKRSVHGSKSFKVRKQVESIEEREAKEMRALRAYNEVTLVEDRREMQARRKSYSHQDSSSTMNSSYDSMDTYYLQKRDDRQSYNNKSRSSNELELNYEDYSEQAIGLVETSTETISRKRSTGENVNVNKAVLEVKENTRPASFVNERHPGYPWSNGNDLHRGAALSRFESYKDGRTKQDSLRSRAVGEADARKRYTKYSKQKKETREAHESLMSCKRTEGLQEGRELGRSAAKENVRRGTSVECISAMENEERPENTQSNRHLETRFTAVDNKKSKSEVSKEIPSPNTKTSEISEELLELRKSENMDVLKTIDLLEEQLQMFSGIQNIDEHQKVPSSDLRFIDEPRSIFACSSESMEIEENIQTSVRGLENLQREASVLHRSQDSNPRNTPLNLREITRNIDWAYHPQGITLINKNLQASVPSNENSREIEQRDIVSGETISLLHEALFCRPEVTIRTFHNGQATIVDPDFGFQRTNTTVDEILNTVRLGANTNDFVCQPDVEVDIFAGDTPRIANFQSGGSGRNDLDQSALLLAMNNVDDRTENSCNLCIVIVGELSTDSEAIVDQDSEDLAETLRINGDGLQTIVMSSSLAAPRLDFTSGIGADRSNSAETSFSIGELVEMLRCLDLGDIQDISFHIEGEEEADLNTRSEEEQFSEDNIEIVENSEYEEKALRFMLEERLLTNIQFPIVVKMSDILPGIAMPVIGDTKEVDSQINRLSRNNGEIEESRGGTANPIENLANVNKQDNFKVAERENVKVSDQNEERKIIINENEDDMESYTKYFIKDLIRQTQDTFATYESRRSTASSSENSMLPNNFEYKVSSEEGSNATSIVSGQNIQYSKDDVFVNPLNEANIFASSTTKAHVVSMDPIETCWSSSSRENIEERSTKVGLPDDFQSFDKKTENINETAESIDTKPLSIIEILIFWNFILFFWLQYFYKKLRPISMSKSTFTSRPYEVHSASTSTSRLFNDSISYGKTETSKVNGVQPNTSILSIVDIKDEFEDFSSDRKTQRNIPTTSVNSSFSNDHIDTVDNITIIPSIDIESQLNIHNRSSVELIEKEIDLENLRNESRLFAQNPTGSKEDREPVSKRRKLGSSLESVGDIENDRNFDDDSLDRFAGFAVANAHASEVGPERKGSREAFEKGSLSRLILRAEEKKICSEEKPEGGSEIDDRKKASTVEEGEELDGRESVEAKEVSLDNESLRRMDSFDSNYTRASTHSSHDGSYCGDSRSSLMEDFPEDNLTNSAISNITDKESVHD